MISRDRLIAASLTSLMCQCTIKPFQCWYCVLALSADLFYFPFDFLLSSIFVFLLTIRSLSLEFVIISSLVYHCFFVFCFTFFASFLLENCGIVITRCVWHYYTVLSRGATWPRFVWNPCGWSSWVPPLQRNILLKLFLMSLLNSAYATGLTAEFKNMNSSLMYVKYQSWWFLIPVNCAKTVWQSSLV